MSSLMPTPPPPQDPEPFMTMHTALVLLSAAFIGLIVGGLSFFSGGPAAAAVLAGLTAFGISVPVLRSLIR
ncbi:hypothetical protein [Streptomyces sp. NPDC002788]